MNMRKSCRWLGCAALLCFTAVELSGCSSKPLISGIRLPGRKDHSSSVAQKDSKPSAKDSTDLLAQAREFEKAGDFPKAARAYREYLNGGGQPAGPERRDPRSIATTDQRRPSQTASLDKPREETASESLAKPSVRPAAKSTSKVPRADSEPAVSASEVGTTEDPWAHQANENPISESLPKVQPNRGTRRKSAVASSDSEVPAARKPAWADAHVEASDTADENALASADKKSPTSEVSPADVENLMHLDDGKIDWGDEPKTTETAEVAAAAEATTAPEEVADPSAPELPLVDLNAAGEMPVEEEVAAALPAASGESPFATKVPSDAWSSHAVDSEPSSELALTDTADSKTLPADEFAPPVFVESSSDATSAADTGDDIAASETTSLALACKDCEPWVYAQAVKLDSPDPEIRKEGLTHLADMGSKARQAGLAVRTLLHDADPLVQAHAAWAMWEIENDPWESVTTLRPLLDHSNVDVVEFACYILGDIGTQADSATDALELLRDHADGTTRIHAAEALIRIHGVEEKSVLVLTTALKSKSSEERWIATVALGRCRGENSQSAVTALTSALKDVDPEVRSAAALSLGGLGQDAAQATPELERVARTDDSQVRDAARAALACLKR